MRLIAKILIGLTSAALVLLVLSLSLTQVVTSPKVLSVKLEKAGVYSLGSDALKSSFVTTLTSANVAPEVANAVVNASVSAGAVATAAQPALQSVSSWLASSHTESLTLSLDLTGIKSQISRQAKLSGSPEVSFVATREIPDQQELVGTKSQQSLEALKAAYQRAVAMIPVLALSTVTGLVLLVLLAFRRPNKRLAWPGWSLVWAGVVGLAIAFITPFMVEQTLPKSGQAATDKSAAVALSLVRLLANDTRVFWFVLLVAGSALVCVSLIIHKDPKKNKK